MRLCAGWYSAHISSLRAALRKVHMQGDLRQRPGARTRSVASGTECRKPRPGPPCQKQRGNHEKREAMPAYSESLTHLAVGLFAQRTAHFPLKSQVFPVPFPQGALLQPASMSATPGGGKAGAGLTHAWGSALVCVPSAAGRPASAASVPFSFCERFLPQPAPPLTCCLCVWSLPKHEKLGYLFSGEHRSPCMKR